MMPNGNPHKKNNFFAFCALIICFMISGCSSGNNPGSLAKNKADLLAAIEENISFEGIDGAGVVVIDANAFDDNMPLFKTDEGYAIFYDDLRFKIVKNNDLIDYIDITFRQIDELSNGDNLRIWIDDEGKEILKGCDIALSRDELEVTVSGLHDPITMENVSDPDVYDAIINEFETENLLPLKNTWGIPHSDWRIEKSYLMKAKEGYVTENRILLALYIINTFTENSIKMEGDQFTVFMNPYVDDDKTLGYTDLDNKKLGAADYSVNDRYKNYVIEEIVFSNQ